MAVAHFGLGFPADVMVLPQLADPNLIIRKAARKLDVFDGRKLVKTYDIALGSCPVGDKEVEGDGKTPEGEYFVCVKNPASKFHLSLGLSYPSREAAGRGFTAGLIGADERDQIVAAPARRERPPQKTALGGEIYIHGGGTERDWTEGCIALADHEMDEIFAAVPIGTKVVILP